MRMALALTLSAAMSASASEEHEVRGRVVDERGRPVAGADVARFWSGNGTHKGPAGRDLDLSKEADVRLFWGDLGRMEPMGKGAAKSDINGSFALMLGRRNHHVMAMDSGRRRGGVAVVRAGREGEPIEVRLAPLVRVRGRMASAGTGKQPVWTHVYAMRPDDPERPVDSLRLASCGSFDARFEILLPPGRYVLDAYDEQPGTPLADRVFPMPEVTLTADRPDVDLGTLTLSPAGPSVLARVDRSKAAGTWGDPDKHYGRRPPEIFAADARGVPKRTQPWDFKGKWVLLDFWGMSCPSCLLNMPKLIRFYEDRGRDRGRFEILSICIDIDGDLKTMADLDVALKPIVARVWGGKALPFPVLLDPSFRTWESYALDGLGMMFLVDPEGNLTKGDLATLEGVLKNP